MRRLAYGFTILALTGFVCLGGAIGEAAAQTKQDKQQVAAAARRALSSKYGGRALDFADTIDAQSREQYLASYDKQRIALLKKIAAMDASREMALWMATQQNRMMSPDVEAVTIDGDRATVPMRYNFDHLIDWLTATVVNNKFVQLAVMSARGDRPEPDVEKLVKLYAEPDHSFKQTLQQQAAKIRQAGVTPAPRQLHMVREGGRWKLDLPAYEKAMRQITDKLKSQSDQPK